MTSPTARTLKRLRQMGFLADVVERWLPGMNRHRDLFGVIDVVAIHRSVPGVMGVQCTTRANAASRLRKIQANAAVRVWLASGNQIEVWGWFQGGGKWQVQRLAVQEGEELAGVPVEPPRRPRRRRKGERQQELPFGG